MRHRFAGGLLSLGLGTLRRLPVPVCCAITDLLAVPMCLGSWLREKLVGRGVHRNLRIVYRDQLTPLMGRRMRWAWARHMTRLVLDFARMPEITAANLPQFVDVSDLHKLRSEVDPGKGLICITGHIGVAELTGHVAALTGMPVTGVFRLRENRAIDSVLERIRSSGGQRVLSKWISVWPLKKALDRGDAVGLAADENTKHKPVFVPFMGTIGATSAMPALLHLATGVPMAVVSVHRVGRLKYRFHLWDIIRHRKTDDRDADVLAVLERMNAALSRSILAYPEQWFWGARRYRERPPDEVMGVDGLPPPCAAASVPYSAAALAPHEA